MRTFSLFPSRHVPLIIRALIGRLIAQRFCTTDVPVFQPIHYDSSVGSSTVISLEVIVNNSSSIANWPRCVNLARLVAESAFLVFLV
jgi:hypothetical protein